MSALAIERRAAECAQAIRADAFLSAEVVHSITEIDRSSWDSCFPGEPEGYDYLLAVEEAGIKGFEWCYVVVRADNRIVVAMPAFLSQYALETTLEPGRLRQAIASMRTVWSKFLSLKLGCLGSPCTETGNPGFHPDVPQSLRPALFELLLSTFEAFAASRNCVLHALKDIPLPFDPELAAVVTRHGYAELGGMPTACMDIKFSTMDEYFAGLSAATRKDMRRKLKVRDRVRIERRRDVGNLLPRIMELYRDTRERSEWQFEELTSAYFDGILTKMPGRAFCTLYFVGDELLAANLMVHDDEVLVDKFFCMDAEKGRAYNLYYLSWFANIEFCLAHRIKRYQSGQAYYANKLRLGSSLTANAMYFRHANRFVQKLLTFVAPYLAIDDTDGMKE